MMLQRLIHTEKTLCLTEYKAEESPEMVMRYFMVLVSFLSNQVIS